MNEKPLRILSLDGGGVRGISSLYILEAIMHQIARDHYAENPQGPKITPKPCEYFDLICGTSTGGLIALMLGRLRMVLNGV
jgi:patatin-like phospholipase/acyl hydrolase